jgi:hypothetical protein
MSVFSYTVRVDIYQDFITGWRFAKDVVRHSLASPMHVLRPNYSLRDRVSQL